MPYDVEIEWIGSDDDVPKLWALLDEELIGIKSEWRPMISQYYISQPSLF